ncbi:MAG: hypothetical protein AB1631_28945 [Acidobacteriota bacterium]
MTATELLTNLQQKGIRLEARGDRLRYAPASAVTPELREVLAAHKAQLLALLKEETKHQQKAKPVHYALIDKVVLGEPQIELCMAGCGWMIKFYWQDGTGYGYCPQCDLHQRIEEVEE